MLQNDTSTSICLTCYAICLSVKFGKKRLESVETIKEDKKRANIDQQSDRQTDRHTNGYHRQTDSWMNA